ncbi:hypothetical protein K469DRAFT_754797 [Zopfia rhizophila CBS 207.26]|uniref:NACHT domain-containing protein n=1 Tax=Zopfia rhizophila CBS 207.26 TaxID=1314779 RepID=A0A6A6DFQ5_9PEZI|nr:hypothetical protein K469DRAFT_754797 [Zopfia rhizophila CBS 207.26]
MSLPNPNHNQVFEQARDQFLASLSPPEKALFTKCPSAEKLVADVEKLGQARKDRLWGKRVVASISALGDSLKPYFETISIFVQSHPEYAAIVWGAFHLMFKLANNYTSFFSKLTKTLDRITHVLPHYDQVAVLCAKGPSRRLQSSLCKVYEDLLRFCQSVVRVFTKENGEAKRSVRVATGLLWKPFDARFDELLDDFKFHADLVKSELLLTELLETREGKEAIASQIQDIKERLSRAEKAREATLLNSQGVSDLAQQTKYITEHKIYEIQRWIDPPQFAQEFERAQVKKEPGTAEWLFLEESIKDWIDLKDSACSTGKEKKFSKRAIWVQGNPGCGKTVLAASAVEELIISSSSGGTKPQVFYYFFRAGFPELQGPIAPLRSFIAQLFHAKKHDRDIIDRFAFIMDEQSSGQLVASRNELLELLQLCTDHSGDVFFVVDGIDESDDSEAVTKDLLALSHDPNIKHLLFSRPNVSALFKTIPEEQRLNIGEKNHRDIEAYVAAQLDELTDEELLPTDSDISELGERLMLGANGMFLWIRLMVNFLNSPALTRRQRVESILNVTVPEGLDSMYNRIARLIHQSNTAEKDMARRIFSWLLYSKRPLTTRELQVAISQENVIQANDEDEFSDFKRTVIMSCAGLVEVQKTFSPTFVSEVMSFQFIHLSAREYLSSQQLDENRNTSATGVLLDRITTGRSDSLVEITNRCLLVLSYSLPAQPLSGSLDLDTTPSQVHETFPFVGYATCYWIDHLEDTLSPSCLESEKLSELLRTMLKFLSLKSILMAYIEASYVFRVIPPVSVLEKWSREILSPRATIKIESSSFTKVIDDAIELSRYLNVLHKEWGSQLLQSPKCIWEEATAFTTSRLVDHTSNTQVRTLIMDAPRTESISSRYLSKISELSEDGKTVAILSIWPSKAFEISAQSSMRPVESMVHILCTGWVARYELWTVADDPVRMADGCIPLDPNEIHLQFQRSMWQDDPSFAAGHWKLQFPTAISPDTRLICIIRTVYFFTVTKRNEARMHAVSLPLHLEPHLEAIWPKPQGTHEPAVVTSPSKEDQRSTSAGFRNSLASLLKPSTGHKRSKSLSREKSPTPDMKSSGSTRSRLWSRSFSRARTPDGRWTFSGSRRYRHWISFAEHGSHLLFLDHLQEDFDTTQTLPSTLILFKVDAKDDLKTSVTASARQAICSSSQLPPPKVLFHPLDPLLAFFFPRAESGSPVMLWDYSKYPDIDIFSGVNRLREVYRTSEFKWDKETVEDVHFSRDGKHLVVQTSNSKAPEVIPLDGYLIPETSRRENEGTTCGSIASSDAITITPVSGPVIHAPGNATSGVFKPDTSITDSGDATGLSVVHTGSQISIRRWSSEGEGSAQETKEEVLRLTRLPAWNSLASSSAAVSVPQPGEEKVRIVLNKSARQWEDMVQDVDVQLPALVSRDVRSLEVEGSDGHRKRIGGGE